MASYTYREMADTHLIYGVANCNGPEAVRMYREKYPDRKVPCHSLFATLHRRLCETGSFDVHKPAAGRQQTTRTFFAEESVLQGLKRDPSTSTRVVSRDTHIFQPTVWRIVHDEGLHPFHLQRVQALQPKDYNKLMECVRWFLKENAAERNFAASVLFTDEATFSLEGVMNVSNLHTWADENAHATSTHALQRKFTLNVWAGIVGDCFLGSYILPERLDGCIYLAFLQEVLPDMLNDVPMPIHRRIRFQHDGAPAHFSRQVRTHLQATFPGRWIGRGGTIAWPPRSPDLSPTDFFFWGFFKRTCL